MQQRLCKNTAWLRAFCWQQKGLQVAAQVEVVVTTLCHNFIFICCSVLSLFHNQKNEESCSSFLVFSANTIIVIALP
jgi:hypothetical protein